MKIKYLKLTIATLCLGSAFALLSLTSSCNKDELDNGTINPPPPDDTTDIEEPPPFDIDKLDDTYAQIADPANVARWGPYNVHDPAIIKEGEFFYSYSTDVAFGATIRPGLQVRKSKDLVEWTFVGWVFPALPPQGNNFIRANGGEPFNGLWAPYVIKVGSTFRLYYSLSSPKPRLSVIGLATSESPIGPWTEQNLVVTSLDNSTIQTNAIDPTVLIDKSGEHWMYYGSAWDGIYILKLNPATGLAAVGGDKGKRIAQRGFTGNKINGNIEGPEIIYNSELDKYFLFIAYDWLETKYNVRVGRSDNPQGPFLDFNGTDMNDETDNIPMILAPYRFGNHLGWQGTSHCAVFKDGTQYYLGHQGRPVENKYFMVLHVRQIFWTEDGWPMVSPERFAMVDNAPVTLEELRGTWDRIVFNYNIVPGYSVEQFLPDLQSSSAITLDEAGSINGDIASAWTFTSPKLVLSWADGTIEDVIVHRGRDWENKIDSTLLFTGLNKTGKTIWGRKKMN
jgi:arabinan endo-1,5-alpha-L-arabinosidase